MKDSNISAQNDSTSTLSQDTSDSIASPVPVDGASWSYNRSYNIGVPIVVFKWL